MEITFKNNWQSYEFYVGERQLKHIYEVKILGKKYSCYPKDILNSYRDMSMTPTYISTRDYEITIKDSNGLPFRNVLSSLAKDYLIILVDGEFK